jgi:putative membrane-bound dehydrogenase-like protein
MKRFLPFGLALLLLPFLAGAARAAKPDGWENASWVWDQAGANESGQSDAPRYLRCTFTLPGKATAAELWITADNHYIAYLNGKKIGEDGEWNTVEKYDVLKHLVPGKNVLALRARNTGGPAGIIARLRIRGSGPKDLYVLTDGHTKITQDAPKGWEAIDFDDRGWFDAIVLGGAGIGPWNLQGQAAPTGQGYDVSAVDRTVQKRLTPEAQKKHFVVPEDFEVELVAADPLVINPITLASDDQGRIYVSESHTYRYGPTGSPVKPFRNPVIRLDPAPNGKGLVRTVVADGFDDPVMGIAIRDGKLWLTANNFLYRFDLTKDGKAINRKVLLTDRNKAWNPFGMFVLEWGPDGLLYMSVGDHGIDIHGPDGKIGGRRNSGIIMRMNPDGTHMERLVHGMRVPYSFEYDPFGQLWVLSNGEGNPNRFLRVIDGVDYHCYSRPEVDNNWLAANHPLAPPCFELRRGAHTQLMRYYGAAFPQKYQGNLLLDNWGAHGFTGPNRAIFRFVVEEHGQIGKKEALISCTDPHFRPSHILLDPDGNLLVADWYGRDDESDMTGRIWRLKYVGKDRPKVTHTMDNRSWIHAFYALSGLDSPSHLVREKAMQKLIARGGEKEVVEKVARHAATTRAPIGAAGALWVLARIGTPEAKAALEAGTRNPDARVRRLALELLRRYEAPDAAAVARRLSDDRAPAVRVAAALTLGKPEEIRGALIAALNDGAAHDEYLRYEAAWHLARHADQAAFAKLLASAEADVRLAGLIAIDVACFEGFRTKQTAQEVLVAALENPGKVDAAHLLTLARLDGDATIVPALEKLVARPDLPLASTASAYLVLKAKAAGQERKIGAEAGKRLVAAVEKGAIRIASPADQLVLLELLEAEGPTPFALRTIGEQIRHGHPSVRPAAHALARRLGDRAASIAPALWQIVQPPQARFEDVLECLATLARIEKQPSRAQWERMLEHRDPLIRTEAVRWWRSFKNQPELSEHLARRAPELLKKDPTLNEDLAAVFRDLNVKPEQLSALSLPGPEKDKAALARQTLALLSKTPAAERHKREEMGRMVFERAACVRCHTMATQTTLLAPSLKGVAAQKADYLIESVLFPSKVIKTGFNSELIVTKTGKSVSGLVKDEGKFLRVLSLDHDERIPKDKVEERSVQKLSIMPEGQETLLSRQEFADLIAYLLTLR